MSFRQGMATVVFVGLATMAARAGDHPDSGLTFLHRIAPVGGCDPDGGSLFHWWNPDCFPRPCGPDDYCRKPFPRFCARPTPPIPISAQPTHHSGMTSGWSWQR